MSDKYKNKYRIPSARAHWWNYSWNGAYFITICTANREHFFGEIENQKMVLSRTGVIADLLWHEIPNHSKFVEIGDFIVMPNHIHGILILDKPDMDENVDDHVDENVDDHVETLHATSLRDCQRDLGYPSNLSKNQKMSAISPKSNSISSIIRSYKSAVTKHTNRLGLPHSWQSRFHDHIIRNDAEYQRISDYIVSNAINWEKDKFNP